MALVAEGAGAGRRAEACTLPPSGNKRKLLYVRSNKKIMQTFCCANLDYSITFILGESLMRLFILREHSILSRMSAF